MRTVLILLLLANLTLFAYTRLDTVGGSEASRLSEQIQAEKIRILTAQQVAALGPSKVAALPDVCIEWGPLGDAERTRAVADLAPLNLGQLMTQKRVEAPAHPSAPGAKAGQRTSAGPQHVIVVRDPPQAVVMRLKELQAGVPGSDIKVGTCDKTP